jgi:hypothetical protein
MEASARTVVSPQRFSRCNMLRFLGGTVAAQRLTMALEHERTCAHQLHNSSTATILRYPFQASVNMDLDLKVFDRERLITEVEKRRHQNTVTETAEKNWIDVCEAVVPNWSRLDPRSRVATG